MRKIFLFGGVACMAMATPLIAQGHGRGHDRGGQSAERGQGGGQQRAQRGGQGQRAEARSVQRAQARNVQREARRDPRMMRGDRSADVRALRRSQQRAAAQVQREERRAIRVDRDMRAARQLARQERRDLRRNEVRQAERQVRREERRDERRAERRQVREDRRDWGRFASGSPLRILPGERRGRAPDRLFRAAPLLMVGGRADCPPGLARQNAYCLPPGQLRHLQAAAYNVPLRYRYRFADGDDYYYRYGDDGIVYRYLRSDGLIDRAYPLYATDLLVGSPMPLGYEVYNVPLAYRSYYEDGGDWLYRYDDGAIYRIDEDNGMIDAIVALLTGGIGGLGGLGVGDALPAGYDVYNVPFDYRDDYIDSDDAWYRYADGSIYQVDPQTQLIEQVISLLA